MLSCQKTADRKYWTGTIHCTECSMLLSSPYVRRKGGTVQWLVCSETIQVWRIHLSIPYHNSQGKAEYSLRTCWVAYSKRIILKRSYTITEFKQSYSEILYGYRSISTKQIAFYWAMLYALIQRNELRQQPYHTADMWLSSFLFIFQII